MRPNIDSNDYNIKMRKIHEFLSEGDKVKVTLRFRGRELAHQDLAMRCWSACATSWATRPRSSSSPRWKGARW